MGTLACLTMSTPFRNINLFSGARWQSILEILSDVTPNVWCRGCRQSQVGNVRTVQACYFIHVFIYNGCHNTTRTLGSRYHFYGNIPTGSIDWLTLRFSLMTALAWEQVSLATLTLILPNFL